MPKMPNLHRRAYPQLEPLRRAVAPEKNIFYVGAGSVATRTDAHTRENLLTTVRRNPEGEAVRTYECKAEIKVNNLLTPCKIAAVDLKKGSKLPYPAKF